MATNGEMWVEYSGKSRPELVAIASARGYDLGEELARAMLRSGTPSPNRSLRPDILTASWRHDFDDCTCRPCCSLRVPGPLACPAHTN